MPLTAAEQTLDNMGLVMRDCSQERNQEMGCRVRGVFRRGERGGARPSR